MNTTCIVCKSRENKAVFREHEVDMLRCLKCGHVFSSWDTDQNYQAFWGESPIENEDQFWYNDAHSSMHDDFCQRFLDGKSGKLLDIGSGLGYFVKRASDCAGWTAYGYEISPRAVEFARTKLGLENVFAGRVEESHFAPASFDIITLWDVVEHIPDPEPLLSYALTLLKSDGILFMHTPNINAQLPKARLKKLIRGMREDLHYIEAKDHVNIYSMSTLAKILHRNGYTDFEFIHLRPVQSVSGSKSRLLKFAKNAWFHSSVALHRATLGAVNFDNLFVVARKQNGEVGLRHSSLAGSSKTINTKL
ncbi:MAG: class I SAM-dependent methyltransferase [Blastocatellia bacterium]